MINGVQERRKELAKQAAKMGEEGKVAIRCRGPNRYNLESVHEYVHCTAQLYIDQCCASVDNVAGNAGM